MEENKKRKIDFYVKGLSMEVRQNIYGILNNVNPSIVEKILERPEGYPQFKSMNCSDEIIRKIEEKTSGYYINVNDIMKENKRYPLFKNENDAYEASKEYVDLLTRKDIKELCEFFGCNNFEEYKPKIYMDIEKKNKEMQIE